MAHIDVGILGATGMVGQQFVALLAAHPWFRVKWLGASSRSEGKTYQDAAAYYEQALAALGRLPEGHAQREQAVDLHFELGRCLYSIGHFDRATSAYREAERLAVALGDEHRVARVARRVRCRSY